MNKSEEKKEEKDKSGRAEQTQGRDVAASCPRCLHRQLLVFFLFFAQRGAGLTEMADGSGISFMVSKVQVGVSCCDGIGVGRQVLAGPRRNGLASP